MQNGTTSVVETVEMAHMDHYVSNTSVDSDHSDHMLSPADNHDDHNRTSNHSTDDPNSPPEVTAPEKGASPKRARFLQVPARSFSRSRSMTVGGGDEYDQELTEPDEDQEKSRVRRLARKLRLFREPRLKLAVLVFFCLIIVSVALIYHFRNTQMNTIIMGMRIKFDTNQRVLYVEDVQRRVVLKGTLGNNIGKFELPYDCTAEAELHHSLCLEWRPLARLRIHYRRHESSNCYSVHWDTLRPAATPRDCYELRGARWYGGGTAHAAWPLNNVTVSKRPFVSSPVGDARGFGPVLEQYWLTSQGVAIAGDRASPLHVSINAVDTNNNTDGLFCLHSDYTGAMYRHLDDELPSLNYSICVDENMTVAHQRMLEEVATPPKSSPNRHVVERPVWSTAAALQPVNQSAVLALAEQLKRDGMEPSVLVIADGWQTEEGDLDFDHHRFPNPRQMMQRLEDLKVKVVLAVSPLVSVGSRAFPQAALRGYLVQDAGGAAAGLLWWRGAGRDVTGGAVDMYERARAWWARRLRTLAARYRAVFTYQCDAGEATLLPHRPHFRDNFSSPVEYTHHYVTAASDEVAAPGSTAHVRAGWRSQHLPLWVRIYDRQSSWDDVTGLRSVIPTALTMGLLGYPFIVSDSVGGAARGRPPGKELYIRWLQLSMFLPALQFSIPPRRYDAETLRIARECLRFRTTTLTPLILSLLEEAATSLTPLVRPLWWDAPRDVTAQTVRDQFLLGGLLVTPVVRPGARSRDVYLPAGTWRAPAYLRSETHTGPRWLRAVSVPLNRFLYFTQNTTLL